jgi:dUTP pyrophosphatase
MELFSLEDGCLRYQKVVETAKDPMLAHPEEDFGYDIFSAETENITIEPSEQVMVRTGLAFEMTDFVYATLGLFGPLKRTLRVGVIAKQPSGLAWKRRLDVKAGVIDAGYRNEVKILLYNYGKTAQVIEPGDKIGQVIPVPVFAKQTKQVDALSESNRGMAGWGSGKVSTVAVEQADGISEVEVDDFASKQEELATTKDVEAVFAAHDAGKISDEECMKTLNEIRDEMNLPPLES